VSVLRTMLSNQATVSQERHRNFYEFFSVTFLLDFVFTVLCGILSVGLLSGARSTIEGFTKGFLHLPAWSVPCICLLTLAFCADAIVSLTHAKAIHAQASLATLLYLADGNMVSATVSFIIWAAYKVTYLIMYPPVSLQNIISFTVAAMVLWVKINKIKVSKEFKDTLASGWTQNVQGHTGFGEACQHFQPHAFIKRIVFVEIAVCILVLGLSGVLHVALYGLPTNTAQLFPQSTVAPSIIPTPSAGTAYPTFAPSIATTPGALFASSTSSPHPVRLLEEEKTDDDDNSKEFFWGLLGGAIGLVVLFLLLLIAASALPDDPCDFKKHPQNKAFVTAFVIFSILGLIASPFAGMTATDNDYGGAVGYGFAACITFAIYPFLKLVGL